MTFKFWCFNAVLLVFLMDIMIPEIVIIFNQISACIAYKSVAYKRHVMLFWRNNFLLWVFCVFILYFIWTIFPDKYIEKWGVWKKYKRCLDHIGGCNWKRKVQSFYKLWINNYVFLWLLLLGIYMFICQIGSKKYVQLFELM